MSGAIYPLPLHHCIQTVSGAHPAFYPMVTRSPFCGGEADQSLLSSAEVKNVWSYTIHSPSMPPWHGAQFKKKNAGTTLPFLIVLGSLNISFFMFLVGRLLDHCVVEISKYLGLIPCFCEYFAWQLLDTLCIVIESHGGGSWFQHLFQIFLLDNFIKPLILILSSSHDLHVTRINFWPQNTTHSCAAKYLKELWSFTGTRYLWTLWHKN
jgi:hypothetical protein